MIVDLWSDRDEIIKLGHQRYDLATAKGRDPKNQGGQKDTAQRHIEGLKAEFAIDRALGREPNQARRNSQGDPDEHDGIHQGWTYNGKYTRYKTGSLPYNPRAMKIWHDIWILVVKHNSDWNVRIAGWIWVSDMPDYWKPCAFDRTAFCISQSQLLRWKDFVNVAPKGHRQPKQSSLF